MTTKRDKVWLTALEQLADRGYIRVRDMDDLDNISQQTKTDVVQSMEDLGLVKRPNERGHTYHMTPEIADIAMQIIYEFWGRLGNEEYPPQNR